MNDSEKKIIENIKEYGCHVTSVFDPDDEEPSFTYSTGITETLGAPEIIVVGLNHELGHFIVNDYRDRLKAGENFKAGEFYSEFIEGFDVTFEEVSEENKSEYMCSSVWFNGESFLALQLVFPTTSGVWPWQEQASPSFKSLQPSLAVNPRW